MSTDIATSGISVIMPTFNQGSFISRTIMSLQLQTFDNWELIIIDDGCTDYTEEVVEDYLADARISYYKNDKNMGLGYSLNKGVGLASFDLIAYLPSDDIYYKDHLMSLYRTITSDPACNIAYAGVRYGMNFGNMDFLDSLDTLNGYWQLVQVLHRRTADKWMERYELVTDDLNVMMWNKLCKQGKALGSGAITCEWVNHPEQHHKLINETMYGGIPLYKKYFGIKDPIKFHSSVGNLVDETSFYEPFRAPSKASQRLKILIVGELAYNAERIYALEEYGHKLYGLWIDRPNHYNAVGPLPFGHVEDIPTGNWQAEVERIKPDIIYALLNHQAISLAYYVMKCDTGIPFVWHFKEDPFIARQHGLWKQLVELYLFSDGQIFINEEMREWFAQFLTIETPTLILDGDLPKKEWFGNERQGLLSERIGGVHTVVPGRPYGINAEELRHFVNNDVHLHFYGDLYHKLWNEWSALARKEAAGYVHFHPHVTADRWTYELSQYDAGWLHTFDSKNNGEIIRANWNDLNYPCRMNTLAAAGLPMIQKSNEGHIVATQNLMRKVDAGIFFRELSTIGDEFTDKQRLARLRDNLWSNRSRFSFDHHVAALSEFFETVIAQYH